MLTDAKLRKLKPSGQSQKLSDSGGLFVFVTPGGTCSWRLKYRIGGKEKLLTLGTYPTLSIAEARSLRDTAKLELKAGKDPGIERKKLFLTHTATDNDRTFETAAHTVEPAMWCGRARLLRSPAHPMATQAPVNSTAR